MGHRRHARNCAPGKDPIDTGSPETGPIMVLATSPAIRDAIADLTREKQNEILNALFKLGLDQNDSLAPLITALVEADLATHQARELVEKTPEFVMSMIKEHDQILV